MTEIPKFAAIANDVRATNEGRHIEQEAIHRDIAAVTMRYAVEEILTDLRAATIPSTQIFDVRQVRELPQLRAKLTRTKTPDGKAIHMQPPAVDVAGAFAELEFPHKYGADTRHVLAEAGYAATDIDALAETGVIA
jgi:crotonobetainyl-CoA:carnitine CoA-transferase CaiB-like acyl-CoA transferase